ncbi:MAG TPA: TlpA disulfide reductase family protein, partial [Urbifossiella sp.]|nr:TlpA disulfide reductase family protein [Urbifossiella sp.]
ELWQKQQAAMTRGRFEILLVRDGYDKGKGMHREEFERQLAGLDLKDVPGFLRRLIDANPLPPDVTRGPLRPLDVRVDGPRRLEVWPIEPPDAPRPVCCTDGKVYVAYESRNRQASVNQPYIGVIGIDDLRFLPQGPDDRLAPRWQVAGRAGGRVTLRAPGEPTPMEVEADERTGFVFSCRDRYTPDGSMRREYRQFGPVPDRTGRVLPTLSVCALFDGDRVSQLEASHVLKADWDAAFTPADFRVSAPAGTNVVDFRLFRDNPKSRVSRAAVPDLLAFADAIPDESRAIWPVLPAGSPAPKLDPAVWLTADGKAGRPPEMADRVVLVAFWGKWCGPCLHELPAVRAAAEKHGKTGLVVVGLHDSSGKAEEVAAVAREHKLTYPLAVDRAGGEGDGFGTTFRAYGVRAVPGAAVIDRAGRVVYVGRFHDALEKAEQELAAGKKDR